MGSKLRSFDVSPEFDSFTKVVIKVSDDLWYEAGTGTGRTLTLENPWGTQAIADDMLASLRGFQYQPYSANDAAVDPAAELGDGITVQGIYSGIYSRRTKFGRLHLSNVSAPKEEEIDHEFPYVPKQQRKVERKMGQMSATLLVHAQQILAEVEQRTSDVNSLRASLDIHAEKIAAKVEKSGGDHGSFGWELEFDNWAVYANGQKVFRVARNGAVVDGEILARSGRIGGFDILSDRLSYNNMDWGGTNTTGIYIGPRGIQCGKNCKIDSNGNIFATSGTFSGNVYAGNIQYGGSYGTFNGSGLTSGSVYGGSGGKIGSGSISTFNTSGGINTSLGNGDYSKDCLTGNNEATYIRASQLSISKKIIALSSITYLDGNGNVATANVLKW